MLIFFFLQGYVITKVDVLKGYMNTIYIDKAILRFAIYYFISQWKRNNISIVVFYMNFKMNELELISKIIIYLKRRKKKG